MTSDLQREALLVLAERELVYIDDELLAVLYRHRAELLAREGSDAETPAADSVSVSGSPATPIAVDADR